MDVQFYAAPTSATAGGGQAFRGGPPPFAPPLMHNHVPPAGPPPGISPRNTANLGLAPHGSSSSQLKRTGSEMSLVMGAHQSASHAHKACHCVKCEAIRKARRKAKRKPWRLAALCA